MATLTRDEMEAVIRNGGSVLHKGQHLTHIEHLPTEGDLAEGDAAAIQAALDGIAAQRAALDEQERKLLASRAPTAPAAPAKSKKGAPPDPSASAGESNDSALTSGTEGAAG